MKTIELQHWIQIKSFEDWHEILRVMKDLEFVEEPNRFV